ncbi:hypothetical protein BCR34DRAFT_608783 [Clohesyomyces aquaticus]|uniref:Uncharacterized protein n=1 Tax=Clohesyomyces aquaticus TaxID=1231657 RepID=A0A1Y1Y3G3_9PLEO|nr:hypothetical protein BCR34DRAFT_608783 [Clohesyomyces aquaticus]
MLDYHADAGHVEMVEYLLKLGAPVDEISSEDFEKRTVISACKRGHHPVVGLLLANGAVTSRTIEISAQQGDMALVKTVLEHGTEMTGGLEKASMTGCRDIVELLLDNGADPSEVSSDFFVSVIERENEPCQTYSALL